SHRTSPGHCRPLRCAPRLPLDLHTRPTPLPHAPLPVVRSRTPPPPRPTLFPYTTLFRSGNHTHVGRNDHSVLTAAPGRYERYGRSEEHTSELQSRFDLVCRLLLEKKSTR